MLGGYQILDIRNIDLSHGSSEASISDASVLAQLLNIRDHIQKTYDFNKPLQNQLKPLLIRYRDKKVGEKHEVACYGNIEVINTYYKFRIVANNEGEQLTINVEFEEKTDEYSNKYWDIKTAKVLLTSAETTIANILASGNVENAKPIYYHGVNLYTDYSANVHGHILNNSNEPIDTFVKFENWLKSIRDLVFFQCEGVVTINGELRDIIAIFKLPNETIGATLKTATGFENIMSISLSTLFANISDGVNKIN